MDAPWTESVAQYLGGGILAFVVLFLLSSLAESLLGGLSQRILGGLSRLVRALFSIGGRRRLLRKYRARVLSWYGEHRLNENKRILLDGVYVEFRYLDDGLRRDYRADLTPKQAVLVLGEAGAGKSVLLKRLLLDWAADSGRRGRVPVYAALHEITGPDVDLVGLLAAQFVDLCGRRRPDGTDPARLFVERELDKGRVLALFDGLDEVGPGLHQKVSTALRDFRRRHADRGNAVIVTSRLSVSTGAVGDAFEAMPIPPFDDASVQEFLELWTESVRADRPGLATHPPETLFTEIQRIPALMDLVRSPLLLNLLVELHAADPSAPLPASRGAFYREIVAHMLDRDEFMNRVPDTERGRFDRDGKHTVLKHVALEMSGSLGSEDDRLSVGWERLRGVAEEVVPGHGERLLAEIHDRSRLLVRTAEGRYRFQHRSFQEFHTALAFAEQSRAGDLLAAFRTDPAFWRDTVRYWCGLREVDCSDVVAALFAEPDHRILALECVAEAARVRDEVARTVLAHFLTALTDDADEAVPTTLGLVAATTSRFSQEVFGALTARADRPAIDALARSGRPEAATSLVGLASADPYAWEALVRMGEAAIPALETAIRDAGSAQAVDALGSIATPAAALALARMVFLHAEVELKQRAAWWLAALFDRPAVLRALRDRADRAYATMPFMIRTESWRKDAWAPFTAKDGSDTVLAAVACWVSALIQDSDPPHGVDRISLRLGVRIAALQLRGETMETGTMFTTEPSADPTFSATLPMSFMTNSSEARARHRDLTDRLRGSDGPSIEAAVAETLTEYGCADRSRELIGLLPPQVQAWIVREWVLNVMPSFSFRLAWVPTDSAWLSAGEQPVPGRNRWGVATSAVGIPFLVAAVVLLGVLTVRAQFFSGWWPFPWPAWALWALLVGAGVGFFLDEVVFVFSSFGELLVVGCLLIAGLGSLFMLGVAVATLTGWAPAVAIVGLPTLFTLFANSRKRRLDRINTNSFGRLLREFGLV
ncbi:NACHT domain-containing protein [Actinocorallia sp. A-T 12471]|uniref:NACHT domain-containing protein n=1 Tax=Actinocorallia sp. A-T 12471 TaxID=3089813 RepID=UPI0029D02F62|nr:NACHT domain-containing protein [Actinocorallia sp. A-T 12471]MDX6743849.1 NACHT domain-containing protein [Actinocorallia sp. A-T 12471]